MSQGRTATVETLVQDGVTWFKKRNPTPELTAIEFKIYEALGDALFLECEMPQVHRDDSDSLVLYVQDVGSSLADDLVLNPIRIEDPMTLFSYLMRTVKVRAVVNETINTVLTDADKAYLTKRQFQTLLEACQRRAPLPGIVAEEDVRKHFWAYRAMNALSIHDDRFKEIYTAVVGSKIEQFMPLYGQWVADNALRNNALRIDDSGILTVVPFDFNCIRYELRQMDEAAVTGIHVFQPFCAPNNTFLRWSQQRYCNETGDSAVDYMPAYVYGALHKQLMLAGYRTQEMLALHGVLEDQLQREGTLERAVYLEFRKTYDEIELHKGALLATSQIAANDPSLDAQSRDALQFLYDTAFTNTRLKRTLLIHSPVMAVGERMFYSRRN